MSEQDLYHSIKDIWADLLAMHSYPHVTRSDDQECPPGQDGAVAVFCQNPGQFDNAVYILWREPKGNNWQIRRGSRGESVDQLIEEVFVTGKAIKYFTEKGVAPKETRGEMVIGDTTYNATWFDPNNFYSKL